MTTKQPTTIDLSGFNRGMAGFVDKLGISAPIVLKKEMGELVKTLVRITPGAEGNKIKDDILRKFELQSTEVKSDLAGHGKTFKQGIEWVGVNSHYLTGIAPDKDMRNASPEELKRYLYKFTKKGRVRVDFKHPRRQQRILLLQRILTKTQTVVALAGMKAKNRGRLKAGWLSAVFQGVIQLTGGNQPPQWVKRHAAGVKGYFINGLGVKGYPTFTIANTAAGVGNKKNGVDSLVVKALSIRVKAMQKNLTLFMRGKKHLADYAK